jgi:Protein of unknown function (DUF1214)
MTAGTQSPVDATKTQGKLQMDIAGELIGHEAERLDDLRSGAAWDMVCDAIRGVGHDMLASEFAESDLERAEGYRYVLGLLTMRLQRLLYRTGPEQPAFTRQMDDVLKFGLDNPDGINSKSAEIRDDLSYRIYGRAGGERYVEFVLSGDRGTLSNHFLADFGIAAGERFEIILSSEPQPGHWIPLVPGAHGLLCRQIQYDWDLEGYTEVHIEAIGGGGVPECLRVPEPAAVAAELRAMAQTFSSEFRFWQDYTRAFRREGDNVIPRDQPLAMSGHSMVRSAPKGFFVIEPDAAMLLEFDDPGGLFWSVAIGDTWFRSIDPSHHQMSLNGAQAVRDADGRYRIVIAHEDPGIANWLDTAGHRRGNITFRYVRTQKRPHADIRVGPLAEILAMLPPDTRRVTPDERSAVIARRGAAYARRYAEPLTTRWSRFE